MSLIYTAQFVIPAKAGIRGKPDPGFRRGDGLCSARRCARLGRRPLAGTGARTALGRGARLGGGACRLGLGGGLGLGRGSLAGGAGLARRGPGRDWFRRRGHARAFILRPFAGQDALRRVGDRLGDQRAQPGGVGHHRRRRLARAVGGIEAGVADRLARLGACGDRCGRGGQAGCQHLTAHRRLGDLVHGGFLGTAAVTSATRR